MTPMKQYADECLKDIPLDKVMSNLLKVLDQIAHGYEEDVPAHVINGWIKQMFVQEQLEELAPIDPRD